MLSGMPPVEIHCLLYLSAIRSVTSECVQFRVPTCGSSLHHSKFSTHLQKIRRSLTASREKKNETKQIMAIQKTEVFSPWRALGADTATGGGAGRPPHASFTFVREITYSLMRWPPEVARNPKSDLEEYESATSLFSQAVRVVSCGVQPRQLNGRKEARAPSRKRPQRNAPRYEAGNPTGETRALPSNASSCRTLSCPLGNRGLKADALKLPWRAHAPNPTKHAISLPTPSPSGGERDRFLDILGHPNYELETVTA